MVGLPLKGNLSRPSFCVHAETHLIDNLVPVEGGEGVDEEVGGRDREEGLDYGAANTPPTKKQPLVIVLKRNRLTLLLSS